MCIFCAHAFAQLTGPASNKTPHDMHQFYLAINNEAAIAVIMYLYQYYWKFDGHSVITLGSSMGYLEQMLLYSSPLPVPFFHPYNGEAR